MGNHCISSQNAQSKTREETERTRVQGRSVAIGMEVNTAVASIQCELLKPPPKGRSDQTLYDFCRCFGDARYRPNSSATCSRDSPQNECKMSPVPHDGDNGLPIACGPPRDTEPQSYSTGNCEKYGPIHYVETEVPEESKLECAALPACMHNRESREWILRTYSPNKNAVETSQGDIALLSRECKPCIKNHTHCETFSEYNLNNPFSVPVLTLSSYSLTPSMIKHQHPSDGHMGMRNAASRNPVHLFDKPHQLTPLHVSKAKSVPLLTKSGHLNPIGLNRRHNTVKTTTYKRRCSSWPGIYDHEFDILSKLRRVHGGQLNEWNSIIQPIQLNMCTSLNHMPCSNTKNTQACAANNSEEAYPFDRHKDVMRKYSYLDIACWNRQLQTEEHIGNMLNEAITEPSRLPHRSPSQSPHKSCVSFKEHQNDQKISQHCDFDFNCHCVNKRTNVCLPSRCQGSPSCHPHNVNIQATRDGCIRSSDAKANDTTETRSRSAAGHCERDTNRTKVDANVSNSKPYQTRYQSREPFKYRFFLKDSYGIDKVLADPTDRRIRAICDRFQCDLEIYSKVLKNGYMQYVIDISSPTLCALHSCTRALDSSLKWCLSPQLLRSTSSFMLPR